MNGAAKGEVDFTWGWWSRRHPSGYEFRTGTVLRLYPPRTCVSFASLSSSTCNEHSYLCLARNAPLLSRRAERCPCPIPPAAGHRIALNIIVKVLPRVGIPPRFGRFMLLYRGGTIHRAMYILPFRLLIRSASLG